MTDSPGQPEPPLPAWQRLLQSVPEHVVSGVSSRFWLRWGMHVALLAAILVSATVVVGTWRIIRTPYPVECVEAGMVQMVDRVLEGKPLYTQPELDY